MRLRLVSVAALTCLHLALFSPSVRALDDNLNVKFSQQSVAGSHGTSFVYFQAQTSQGPTTVPTRRFASCPVPYYAEYTSFVPDGDLIYFGALFHNCSDGSRIDPSGGATTGAMGWTTQSHQVLAGVHRLARGKVVYALSVSLEPQHFQAGQQTRLTASLADDFVAQADRTLNISVDPRSWAVTSWDIDFGDGQHAVQPGGSAAISAQHQYSRAQAVEPRVTAHVAGTAQVADFNEATGGIVLLDEPFTVDVSNDTSGQLLQAPVIAYQPPSARAAVSAQLEPGPPPVETRGVDRIEVPRGTSVYLYVRPIIDAEGQMTLNGNPGGSGHTVIRSWKLTGGSTDGPPGQVAAQGATGPPEVAIVQQWDHPDRIGGAGAEPYLLTLEYTVRTTYPDGQARDFNFAGPVSVTVAFAASSG